jgi:polysaccharide pyruvyl transferase WcaK-like protein
MTASDILPRPVGGRERRIVLTGTFDVRNYGDLLFPLIAAQRLAPFGLQIVAASPTGHDTGWRDAMPPQPLPDLLAEEAPFDGVLIGGGNIIHSRPVTLPDYRTAGVADWAYPALWLGATLAASRRKVPVAWNAPGVPYAFSPVEQSAASAALAAASYVAVRDATSAGWLQPGKTHVVPDTALGLSSLWPRASLEPDFRALLARHAPAPGPYVAIHVKERSLDEPLGQLAIRLEEFCAATGRTPILIGIGQCHGDHEVATALARDLGGACIDLGLPVGLREIAAAIAFSDAYIGASLHGYVTAVSYGRSGVIVGKPHLPKMQGLLSQIGREADEAVNWSTALEQMRRRIGTVPPVLPTTAMAALDRHWEAVIEALTILPLPLAGQSRLMRLAEPDGQGVGLAGALWQGGLCAASPEA